MMIACNLSINTIEFLQLRRIFQMLKLDVTLSHRTKLATIIDERAVNVKAKLLHNFSSNAKVFISLNEWTSSNHKVFMTIMIFYFTEFWSYRRVLLIFEELKEVHSDQNLIKVVNRVLQKYDLHNRLIAITIDNASNNESMIKHIEEATSEFKNISRISCLIHVIQLTVKSLLKTLIILSSNEIEKSIWERSKSLREFSKISRFDRTLYKIDVSVSIKIAIEFLQSSFAIEIDDRHLENR